MPELEETGVRIVNVSHGHALQGSDPARTDAARADEAATRGDARCRNRREIRSLFANWAESWLACLDDLRAISPITTVGESSEK